MSAVLALAASTFLLVPQEEKNKVANARTGIINLLFIKMFYVFCYDPIMERPGRSSSPSGYHGNPDADRQNVFAKDFAPDHSWHQTANKGS